MNSKDFKETIVHSINETLKDRHFKKKGHWFRYSNTDLTYYIGLQSSQSSTAGVLIVTINTEIASKIISELSDTSIPIDVQRHYHKRLGEYLDDKHDKWWIIESDDAARSAAIEIATIINERVLPTFDNLKSTSDLASLWKAGLHTGITEVQRRNFIELFDKVM